MSSRRDAPAEDLLDRPLTARSVLASMLLGLNPPVLPVRRLVEVAGLFGISEGTARVALSRMAAAGEVVTDGGDYRLSGRLLERQRTQIEGRRPRRRAWRGGWNLAIVVAERRSASDRAELRTALTAMRLAEWREGVWARPDNLDLTARPAITDEHCSWASARLDEDDVALARRLWDLDAWRDRARDLLERVRATPLDNYDVLATGFVISAAVIRHLRSDPLLPDELLPPRWPGDDLRRTFDAWNVDYAALLDSWHRRGAHAEHAPHELGRSDRV